MNENLLFDFLKQHNIAYQLFEHQPVFRLEDNPVVTAINGIATISGVIPDPHFKTLFLKTPKNQFFLVSVMGQKRVDLNELRKTLMCERFSFGNSQELLDLLRLTPGSVNPFGLIFDTQNKIRYVLDQEALAYPQISFHPMRNDMTIVISTKDFLTCMQAMEHQPQIVVIPVK